MVTSETVRQDLRRHALEGATPYRTETHNQPHSGDYTLTAPVVTASS